MAPIKNILYQMTNTTNKRDATYYFGANIVKELFLLDQMRTFETELANFKFVPIAAAPDEDENWDGQRGLVTEAVQQNLENAPECEGYLCGSTGMIDASIKILLELGMSEEKIFFDKFE